LSLLPLAEPIGQVQEYPRKKSGLHHSEEEARDVQLRDTVHDARERGDNSPANQYACDPDPCSDLVKQEIAGDLKQEITEKEDPNEQSKLLARNRQILIHCQCREADVDAVKISDDVEKKEERNDPDP
jgi:hypothetical protein